MNHDPENLVDLLGEDAPSERMAQRLREDIAKEKQRGQRRPTRRRWTWAAAAVVLLAVGIGGVAIWPRADGSTAMVLEALASRSPLRRSQGVMRAGILEEFSPQVRTRLVELLRTDPDTNVRLTALRVLASRDPKGEARKALLDVVTTADTPIVQAHVVSTLRRAEGGLSPDEIGRLRSMGHLDATTRSLLDES